MELKMKRSFFVIFFAIFIALNVFTQDIKNAINDYFSYEVHKKNEYWKFVT